MAACALQRDQVHSAGRTCSFKGRTHDGLYGDFTCGSGYRKVVVASEDFARALQPVLRKTALLFEDGGTFHAYHDVTPGFRVVGFPQPMIRQSRTAGEGHLAVDDQG